MANTFCVLTWAVSAWGIALLLIGFDAKVSLYSAVAAGTATALTTCILYVGTLRNAVPWGVSLAFLALAIVFQFRGRSFANPAASFYTAAGAMLAFFFSEKQLGQVFGDTGGSWGSILLSAAFLCLALMMRGRFLPEYWREYFAAADNGRGGPALRRWHVYVLLLLDCLLNLAGLLVLPPMPPTAALLSVALFSSLFWITLLAAALIVKNEHENAISQIDHQYRSEVESFISVIRSQRHDYNFHIQTLAGLIQAEDWEACRNYVHILEQDSSRMNALLPLRDPAVSAMIHSFQTLMARAGIELHVSIQNDLAQIATSVYETNKIISNLLQNALDETATHSDKSYGVHLSIIRRGEFCVIRVSNRLQEDSHEKLDNLYRQGFTTKEGHEGVGLSSIRTLAARYNGTIYAYLDQRIIHFVAKIPITYAKDA